MPGSSEQIAATRPSKAARTRARILEAAEEIIGRRGYHEASISEITRLAGVAQGSFYVHFPSKIAIFEELIRTRGRELREALHAAAAGAASRAEMERAGFGAFFDWIARHRWLYRVARQAEFISPELREEWYREFADVYASALARAMRSGEIPPADPAVLAWAVMGMADFTAMRWIVWEDIERMPAERLDAFLDLAARALGISTAQP